MKTIGLQRSAIMFPGLLQNDGKLRLHRQQELHKHVTAKAVTPLLRKIERAAHEILLVMSEFESPADPITQARMMTRLLELPKSERSISSKEHNDIVNGHEFYLGAIAEKLRVDLAYIHLAMEKFVEKATEQEHRLAALHLGLQELLRLRGGALPQLVLDYGSPGHHKCRCEKCTPDIRSSLREQIRSEIEQEVVEEVTTRVRQEVMEANALEQRQKTHHREVIDQE